MEKLAIKLRQGVSKVNHEEVQRVFELVFLVGIFAFMLIAMAPLY